MAYPGAKFFFITAARYPIISSQCLRNKTKVLAVLAESLLMILLGTICKGKEHLPQRASLKQVAMMCQDISAHLRPQGIPQPQWGGTNKLLPIFQSSRPVWELLIDTDAAQWAKPRKLLQEFWQQTNERRLSGAKCEEILVAAGLGITTSLKIALRGFYRGILDEHGQVYEGLYHKWLKKLAILWVAIIIQQAEELDLVSGPDDGLYMLEEGGLNWSGISVMARRRAPADFCQLYSKQGCLDLFCKTENRRFTKQILYQCNWDRLKG